MEMKEQLARALLGGLRKAAIDPDGSADAVNAARSHFKPREEGRLPPVAPVVLNAKGGLATVAIAKDEKPPAP